MNNDDVELLFGDDEDNKVNEETSKKENAQTEDFIKDPSFDSAFPDKKEIDINHLLNKFEEETNEYDDNLSEEDNLKENKEIEEKQEDNKNNDNDKKKKDRKMKLWQKVVVILICLGLICGSGLAFLLYGPYSNFRNWLITTAMTTMNHKYLATWFYDDDTINDVMQQNYVDEIDQETDLNAISFVDYSNSKVMYKNKYEKEILTHEEGATYKLININEDGMRGYLVAVYDPSKVKVATATNMSSSGEMLTTIAKKNNAVVAMNASGFFDPGYVGNGGKPHGAVIKDGKLISNLSRSNVGGGIIGFTNDNKLIMGKMTAEEALAKSVRDAVEFGPFLVVNGEPSFIKGNGGWGIAPRTAIGQRADGIVLFLVINGRIATSIGADMGDLTEIMENYGAINAANMDGGSSSALVINNKIINHPVAGGDNGLRDIPTFWIVK